MNGRRSKPRLWNRHARRFLEEELLTALGISDQKPHEHVHQSSLRMLENIYGKDRRPHTDVDEVRVDDGPDGYVMLED
jgi:hypothetical protein